MTDSNPDLYPEPDQPLLQVQPAPLPVSYQFDPVMIGDRKAYMLSLQTAGGRNWFFFDEDHATRLRDRITECVTGLVLP